MLKLDVFTATFAAMILAELGDKTQLLSFALATRGNPLTAFLATSIGFAAANLLTAPLGLLLRSCFDPSILRVAVGVLFIGVGILTLLKREAGQLVEGCGFVKSFLLMFLAELGDKTNLTAIALTASTGSLVEVALGIIAAAVTLMALAAALGSLVAHKLPVPLVRKIVGLLFVIVGVATLALQ